jgi:hypothetical protein
VPHDRAQQVGCVAGVLEGGVGAGHLVPQKVEHQGFCVWEGRAGVEERRGGGKSQQGERRDPCFVGVCNVTTSDLHDVPYWL